VSWVSLSERNRWQRNDRIRELLCDTTGTNVYELLAINNYQEKILGYATDGNDLILDSAGNLYGTSVYGGSRGNGFVFKVTP
jgi:uncharacterized repeat protein (TIGR03803 family)